MNILAISSSRAGNGGYLECAVPLISSFLESRKCTVAFIPFASVLRPYEAYGAMVEEAMASLPVVIETAFPENAKEAIDHADVIMVGGGNTFKLLHDIYKLEIFHLVRQKVHSGIPYIGWSAGANLAGKTLSTTNDMPIIQPLSFEAFAFLPFQINPHYVNQAVENHHGETRDQRLEEFVLLNRHSPVVALPEGSALQCKAGQLKYIGDTEAFLFAAGEDKSVKKQVLSTHSNLSYLLQGAT